MDPLKEIITYNTYLPAYIMLIALYDNAKKSKLELKSSEACSMLRASSKIESIKGVTINVDFAKSQVGQ